MRNLISITKILSLFFALNFMNVSIANAGSSSSSGVIAESHFSCYPSRIADAGYNVYVTYNPLIKNSFKARLGEISFFGEKMLPKTYELELVTIYDTLVLKNPEFELQLVAGILPVEVNKHYPATLVLRGELSTHFSEIAVNCVARPDTEIH